MLGDEGMVEQIILGRHLPAPQGFDHQLVELVRIAFVAAEPHQRHEFRLLARA